tara:strand:+ start:148 stop:273 length:126 start_codon:yes stop_codon:yes gene_type:complete
MPQVAQLLPLLRCGVGVHHSGLLPVLRELVEAEHRPRSRLT